MRRFMKFQRPSSSFLAAAIVCAILSPVIVMMMDNTLPRVITQIEVMNNPVTPGQPIKLRFEGEGLRDCPATIREFIIDGNNIVFPVAPRFARLDLRSGHFSVEIEIPTPISAAPGAAIYRSIVEYECNPWQKLYPLTVRREVNFVFAAPTQSGFFSPGVDIPQLEFQRAVRLMTPP